MGRTLTPRAIPNLASWTFSLVCDSRFDRLPLTEFALIFKFCCRVSKKLRALLVISFIFFRPVACSCLLRLVLSLLRDWFELLFRMSGWVFMFITGNCCDWGCSPLCDTRILLLESESCSKCSLSSECPGSLLSTGTWLILELLNFFLLMFK